MTILSIVRAASSRLSLPIPAAVVSATDKTTIDMLALAQQEGMELSRRTAWKALTAEKTFSTTAASAQTGALPSDLDWIIPETMFNRDLKWRVVGPISSDEWQLIQASLTSTVFPAFRIRGTSLLMTPTPTAGQTVGYEYITKNWCQSSLGAPQAAWTADSDTAILDEELHTLGLIWRFLRSKGLDFTAELAEYEKQVSQAMLREGVRPVISTDPNVRLRKRGADAIAGTKPNVIVNDVGDYISWDG